MDSAKLLSRDCTGVGIFVEFSVPDELAIPTKEKQSYSNLEGQMERLANGFGAVLFVEDGKIQLLEFFTYDEPWPKEGAKYWLSNSEAVP